MEDAAEAFIQQTCNIMGAFMYNSDHFKTHGLTDGEPPVANRTITSDETITDTISIINTSIENIQNYSLTRNNVVIDGI